jgi:hypothetical protein
MIYKVRAELPSFVTSIPTDNASMKVPCSRRKVKPDRVELVLVISKSASLGNRKKYRTGL